MQLHVYKMHCLAVNINSLMADVLISDSKNNSDMLLLGDE